MSKEKTKNREIEILKHTISYWYRKDQEMPESEQEHVQKMIIEGCSQGELNDNNENRGWWSIKWPEQIELTPLQKAAPELLEACKKLKNYFNKRYRRSKV